MIKEEPVHIFSETGRLRKVIIHTPGPEIENMTPGNAERALYSDILNLQVAREEYAPFRRILELFSEVYEVKALLKTVLENNRIRENLVRSICENEEQASAIDTLMSLSPDVLSKQLIEGIPMIKDTLTRYLSKDRFSLKPLHNLFFTRDTGAGIFGHFFSSRMATRVRAREASLMEFVFRHHPAFQVNKLVSNASVKEPRAMFEGGDIQVVSEEILLMGNGVRTSSEGIDLIIQEITRYHHAPLHIIVQELPPEPESFIHLDMVFTMLDEHQCMIYEPVILHPSLYQTVLISAEGGKVKKIRHIENIPAGLRMLGLDLDILYCGGRKDPWIQQREQWHSGANFFAVAPGKVLGYARNVHTLEELNNRGYEVIPADDVVLGKKDPIKTVKCVITLSGSELARGGGGARCMTLPLDRD
ncbi:MAG: arginine deiminase [Chlorobi bacterium]|nr:arginine deiminase [Chlorobiota bacterium]